MSLAWRMLGAAARLHSSKPFQRLQNEVHKPFRLHSRTSVATAAWAEDEGKFAEKMFDRSEQNFQELLVLMDTTVRRTGRVGLLKLNEAIRLAEKLNPNQMQTLQLVRATGMFLREIPPHARATLTASAWKIAVAHGIDIAHYNALLQVYLENEMSFDPMQILNELKEANLEPNRVTYQRLVQRYCEVGDISGATKILELMKTHNVPLSERVFHSLVKGHALVGDEESALKTIDLMRSARLEPTAETQTVLAIGLARAGQAARAVEVLANHGLSDQQILRVVKVFAEKDDIDSVERTLEHLPLAVGHVQDIINACTDLLSRGKFTAARTVFDKVPYDPGRTSSGSYFIGHLVKCGCPMNEVLALCDELRESGRNREGLTVALESALRHNSIDSALDYLKAYSEKGKKLRTSFFYPVLAKAASPADVYRVLGVARALNVPITLECLQEFVLTKLDREEPMRALNYLTRLCGSTSTPVTSMSRQLILDGRFDECVDVLQAFGCAIGRGLPIALAEVFTKDNAEDCIRVLRLIKDRTVDLQTERSDPIGLFLERLPEETFKSGLEAVAKTSLPLRRFSYERLLAHRPEAVMLKDNVDLAEEEAATEPHGELTVRLDPASISQLNEYCRSDNVEAAEDLLGKSQAELPVPSQALLVDLYRRKGDLASALKHYHTIQSKGARLHNRKIIDLAVALIEDGQLDEALRVIRDLSSESANSLKGGRSTGTAAVRTALEKYGLERAFQFVDEIAPRLKLSASIILRPIIESLVEQKETTESLSIVRAVADRYRSVPCKESLWRKVISSRDENGIRELMDICSGVYGRKGLSIRVAMHCVEVGDLERARTLLEQESLINQQEAVGSALQFLVAKGDVSTAETFADFLYKVAGYRGAGVYHILIKAYCQKGEVDKALEVWMDAQESNVVLHNEALDCLARTLKEDGRDIPFNIPNDRGFMQATPLRTLNRSAQPGSRRRPLSAGSFDLSEGFHNANSYIKTGKIDEALEGVRKKLETGEEVSRQHLRFLLKGMARAAMIEEISSLKSLLQREPYQHLPFGDSLAKAYLTAGRITEFLDLVESDVSRCGLGSGCVVPILRRHPELFERLLTLAKKSALEGTSYGALSMIWQFCMVNRDFSRAEAILEDVPGLRENFNLRRSWILDQIEKSLDIELSERVLVAVKDSSRKGTFGMAFSSHLNVMISKGKIEEAQTRLYEECERGMDIHCIAAKTLENLEQQLVSLGKEVKFKVLPKEQASMKL